MKCVINKYLCNRYLKCLQIYNLFGDYNIYECLNVYVHFLLKTIFVTTSPIPRLVVTK